MSITTERRLVLSIAGADVVRHTEEADMDHRLSPRPYLHPVRTLAGTMVSDAFAPDHPHHLGLSLAVSDLNGVNFWGGRTFTPHGSVLLPNHGRQVTQSLRQRAQTLTETIRWLAPGNAELALEQRRIEVHRHPHPGCWALSLSSSLQPAIAGQELRISSSAVKGRAGAGYGGLFWRFPRDARAHHVMSGAASGTANVHGSRHPWLSMSIIVAGKPATVVLLQTAAQPLPWFVRTEGYLGAGPALAWSTPRTVTSGAPLHQSLLAVIADQAVSSAHLAESLLRAHPAADHRSNFPN